MSRKWLIALILFILVTAGSVPLLETAPASADGGIEISASSVNVRSGPGLSYSVEGSLKKGEKVTEVSRSGDWIEIQTGNGTGWVAAWLTAKASTASPSKTAVSTVNRLNVRSQPSQSSSVLTQMNAGDQAKVVSDAGQWMEVDFRNTRGFVSKQYISLTKNNAENPAPAASDISSFQIAVSALNVRTEPDLNSSKQGTVREGEVYPVKKLQGNWVQIQLDSKTAGWVYSFYGHLSDQSVQTASDSSIEAVTVQTNGTNLRVQASTSSAVVRRANAGEVLKVTAKQGDWYQVSLSDGNKAFIASWVVAAGKAEVKENEKKTDRKKGTLNGVTIVLDPGHGGYDSGAIGARKTQEKDVTLKTAEVLSHYLRAAGADVQMTRQSDVYVGLRNRVSESHQVAADAFISIHYDATSDRSISGFTSYYQHGYQKELAAYLNSGIDKKLSIRNRGVQSGNYLVLRENRQAAVLVELGFLSNYNDERLITTEQFRQQAALGLYNGIINYFDAQLGK